MATWPRGPPYIVGLDAWATRHGITGATWTNLRSNFDNDLTPDIDQVLQYLRGLVGEQRSLAEEYVRKTPRQVQTPYRQHIEAELGWTPIDHG